MVYGLKRHKTWCPAGLLGDWECCGWGPSVMKTQLHFDYSLLELRLCLEEMEERRAIVLLTSILCVCVSFYTFSLQMPPFSLGKHLSVSFLPQLKNQRILQGCLEEGSECS